MAEPGHDALEVITMDLQGQTFALEAVHVREILDLVPITEVPGAQPFVAGLINVRGKVVPLADLRLKFGMEQTADTIDTRIVVIEIDVDRVPTVVGIRADKVHEVTTLDATALSEVPRVGTRWRQDYIRFIGKHGDDFIVVPDIARILVSGAAEPANEAPKHDRSSATLALARPGEH
ncbi:Positive regulator of CheA protein activity (CheW) [Rhodovulum sp. PH10]|uniref:chemotaxis protein CheW n=1 Tax=Rhodovulum sp. PH10 TaxID=1187851 RepID=UPI00027C26AD|nr:chemotaxis protein CheW [Rhodovulum sp. PH10]EJW10772.1 Positive regulator of CheA protein activity (CheW) [Rhodovulum sp. PH10]